MTFAVEAGVILARDLCGLPTGAGIDKSFPRHSNGVRKYLRSHRVRTVQCTTNGGTAVGVAWGDLSEDTRIAYLQRAAGVTEEDEPDHAVWSALAAKKPASRERAERDHSALLSFEEKVQQGQGPTQATREVCQEFGVSWQHVRNLRDRVEGIPRADWLPTLAPGYKPGGRRVEISDDAWTFFLSFLKESSPRMPLTRAHRETLDAAELHGWAWPSYGTVLNRWNDIPKPERALIRHGSKALDKTIPPMTRSVAHLRAMQIVNMDGRKGDVFARWEDGTVCRYIVIAIQDVYSRCIIAWRFAKTEDSDTTKAVILDVLDRHGLFGELKTDNSRAFASKKITGGADHRFRGKATVDEVLGILPMLDVKVGFSIPEHGQSKPIERGFRDLAEQIDTLPEFKGAYCGHRPDAKPEDFDGTPVDMATVRAVYEREIRKHNEQPARRTETGKGKLSFSQVFEESYRQQPRRDITRAQRMYFMLDGVPLKPNKDTGALKKDGFTWWSPQHQDTLLKHRNRKVLVLFDPTDRSKPVMVQDREGRVIIESLPMLERGRFDSTEDARQYARGKAQIKKAARSALKARKLMTAAELANARKLIHDAQAAPQPPASDTNVSQPLFGKPGVRPGAAAPRPDGTAAVERLTQREEFEANLKRGYQKLREERLAG